MVPKNRAKPAFMVDVENDIPLLKAALQRGLRVAVLFKLDEDILEYHFQKVPTTKDRVRSVLCVYASGCVEDKLGLSGSVKTIEKFEKMLMEEKVTENFIAYYERCGTKLYPEEWMPCYYTKSEKKPKLKAIEEQLEELAEEAKEVAELDKEERADAERMRLEREKLYQQAQTQQIEKEAKAREEARRKIKELSIAFKGLNKQPPK